MKKWIYLFIILNFLDKFLTYILIQNFNQFGEEINPFYNILADYFPFSLFFGFILGLIMISIIYNIPDNENKNLKILKKLCIYFLVVLHFGVVLNNLYALILCLLQ